MGKHATNTPGTDPVVIDRSVHARPVNPRPRLADYARAFLHPWLWLPLGIGLSAAMLMAAWLAQTLFGADLWSPATSGCTFAFAAAMMNAAYVVAARTRPGPSVRFGRGDGQP